MYRSSKTTLICLAVILISLSGEALCQIKNYNTESEFWFDGTLYLNDGRTFKGEINYIFVNDLVRIRNHKGQIKTLVANNVSEFVLFDSAQDRRFYALPYDVEFNGYRSLIFFEQLYSNKHYSILSRHVMKKTKSKDNYFYFDLSSNKEKVIQVIYLADTEGQIMPLLERKKSSKLMLTNIDIYFAQIDVTNEQSRLKRSATQKEVKKYRRAKNEWTRNDWGLFGFEVQDKISFKDFFGRDYRRFKAYVEREELNPKKLEDLVLALDFKS